MTKRNIGAAFLVAVAPFFINDFFYLGGIGYEKFLAVDYAGRGLSVLIVVVWAYRNGVHMTQIGFASQPGHRLFFWSLLTVTVTIYLAVVASVMGRVAFPQQGLAGPVPYDRSSPLFFYDYHFGLLMVAFSEELVARGFAFFASRKCNIPFIGSFLISPVLFALFHWSSSPWNIFCAYVFGVLFMIPTYRTGNILPATSAHYVANMIMI